MILDVDPEYVEEILKDHNLYVGDLNIPLGCQLNSGGVFHV